MFWILLAAIIGSTIAIVYLVWRRWIAPWRQIERFVRQIGRGEQPRTFLVEGGKEAQRVSVALEDFSVGSWASIAKSANALRETAQAFPRCEMACSWSTPSGVSPA